MAEQLTEFEFSDRGRPGGRYDHYLDGSIWRLTLEDFPGVRDLQGVRSSFYNQATRRGIKVRASMRDGFLVVQAYKLEDE